MHVVLVSDIHIHPWQEHSSLRHDGPSRLLDCVTVLDDVLRYCLNHSIEHVIVGGDLFHKRGIVYTQAYNLIVERLAAFKKHRISVYMVDGNHDHANKTGTVHCVQALIAANLVFGIPAFRGYTLWDFREPKEAGTELIVSALSYCDDKHQFDKRLTRVLNQYEHTSKGYPHILVCHHGFKNARVGTALEYQVKEEIDPEILRGHFDHIFSGHYHTRQKIGALDNAIYIGSPLENTRGEGGTRKGFIDYNTKTHDWKLVPIKRPKFIVLSQESINDKNYDDVEGNYVDVVYTKLKNPDAFRERLFKLGAAGVKLVPRAQKRVSDAPETRLDVNLGMDGRTLLKRYLAHCKASKTQRTTLLELGIELLEKAQQ